MNERIYDNEEVVERIVEWLMRYRALIKPQCPEIADQTYEKLVTEIKHDYGFNGAMKADKV